MTGALDGKPLHVSVRSKAKAKDDVTVRWERENGSDAEAVDRIVQADPKEFWTGDGKAAAALVRRLRQSPVFLRMTSQVAEHDGEPCGYVLLTQALVGDRTYLLLAGVATTPDAPEGTRNKLLATVLHTARAAFYSALVTTLGPDGVPGVKLEPIKDRGVTAPAGAGGEQLWIGELLPGGIDPRGGALTLDEAFLARG